MRLNQLDKMQQVCEAAVRIAPGSPDAHNSLGMSYFAQGKYLEAVNSFSTAILLDGENPMFRENLAEVYEKLGESEQAAHEFKMAGELKAKQKSREE